MIHIQNFNGKIICYGEPAGKPSNVTINGQSIEEYCEAHPECVNNAPECVNYFINGRKVSKDEWDRVTGIVTG